MRYASHRASLCSSVHFTVCSSNSPSRCRAFVAAVSSRFDFSAFPWQSWIETIIVLHNFKWCCEGRSVKNIGDFLHQLISLHELCIVFSPASALVVLTQFYGRLDFRMRTCQFQYPSNKTKIPKFSHNYVRQGHNITKKVGWEGSTKGVIFAPVYLPRILPFCCVQTRSHYRFACKKSWTRRYGQRISFGGSIFTKFHLEVKIIPKHNFWPSNAEFTQCITYK